MAIGHQKAALSAILAIKVFPDPPFLAFFDFLAFFHLRFSLLSSFCDFLCFLGAFWLFLSKDVGVSLPEKARQIAEGKGKNKEIQKSKGV